MTRPAWGKTDGPDASSHHLAHHCMGVAAVFQRLLGLPAFRNRAENAMNGSLSPTATARLGVLVFLHDIGKLHPEFQANGWPKGSWSQPFEARAHLTNISWRGS